MRWRPTRESGPADARDDAVAENGDGAVYNAAVLLDGGRIAAVRYKHELPNYGVFDEKRVFAVGPLPDAVDFRGVRLGVTICEDIWYPTVVRAPGEPGRRAADRAQRIAVRARKAAISASRWRPSACARPGSPLIYVNQVGGQDELVFDGGSFVINRRRNARRAAAGLERGRRRDALDSAPRMDGRASRSRSTPHADEPGNTYQALMVGLRDYVNKNRFPGVLLGLSGGIDSALTAAVAVDALGPDRVLGAFACRRGSRARTARPTPTCQRARLGMQLETIPIGDVGRRR